MTTSQWAEQECRLACKRENQNYDFDGNDFDYGCNIYKSVLKAYNSLCEDGHSGYSFSQAASILKKLLDGHPLSPIEDKDFFIVERGTSDFPGESEEYLAEHNLKSHLQCPRMFSLFREETLDGKVTYHDVDRAYYVNIEDPSDTFSSWCGFIDDMFPITMPYVPEKGKYKIYTQTFLTDQKNGDFDTRGIFYVITPSGEKVDLNIYQHEDNGKWKDISKEEYLDLLNKRIDPLNIKVAEHLIWTLISNSSDDEQIEKREKSWKNIPQNIKDRIYEDLENMCTFFEDPEHYQYNTFKYAQALCRNEEKYYNDVPELVEIAKFLQKTLINVISKYK